MTKHPRIELDASRLLGFKQSKEARAGRLAGHQAKVCGISAPEPSTWVELLLGFLMLGFFALRGHLQKKKTQPDPAPLSPKQVH